VKRCTVACDTPAGILTCELQLAQSATIQDALQAARLVLGEAGVPWDAAAIGIFGKLCTRAHVWQDGERIEIYRPLQRDPRAHRRQRALKKPGPR
jgi:putative ubiquitin-RnfH superfamily antitoxin RatB of RatAB toxin-antitoxin module